MGSKAFDLLLLLLLIHGCLFSFKAAKIVIYLTTIICKHIVCLCEGMYTSFKSLWLMDVYTVHLVVSTLADQLLTPIAMHSNVTPGGIQKVFIPLTPPPLRDPTRVSKESLNTKYPQDYVDYFEFWKNRDLMTPLPPWV